MINRTSLKLSNFQAPLPPPPTPVYQRQKFLHPVDLGRPILNEHPNPLQQNMQQQPHRVYERTKSKQKQNQATWHSNWPRVLLFDLVHKHCNGIMKGWLHRLTSESIGRFLVNNIFFNSACLVIAQSNFRTLVTPHSPMSDNIWFLSYPPPPQKEYYMCITPYMYENCFVFSETHDFWDYFYIFVLKQESS